MQKEQSYKSLTSGALIWRLEMNIKNEAEYYIPPWVRSKKQQ